jgi:heterogeneous nuclear ribonucleoprotein F/H
VYGQGYPPQQQLGPGGQGASNLQMLPGPGQQQMQQPGSFNGPSASQLAAQFGGLSLGGPGGGGVQHHNGMGGAGQAGGPGNVVGMGLRGVGAGAQAAGLQLGGMGGQGLPHSLGGAGMSGGVAGAYMAGGPRVVPAAASPTIKIRGLPYGSSPTEILGFFQSYQFLPDTLQIGLDQLGRPSGEAWLSFSSPAEALRAVRDLNRQYLGNRYLELSIC